MAVTLLLLALFSYEWAQAQHYILCPLTTEDDPGVPTYPVACTGCDCSCPYPDNPQEMITGLKPGQIIKCFQAAPEYEGTPPPQEIFVEKTICVGTGAPVVDCNNDSTVPSSDVSWLQPPAGYEAPDLPQLVEGFWGLFFYYAGVPAYPGEVEANLTGPLYGGEDDPDQDLVVNSQYKVLPFCASPRAHPCYDLEWRARLENCQKLPTTAGTEAFKQCMNNFDDFFNCVTDIERGGPWDVARTRTIPGTNASNYMEHAQQAAVEQAQNCVEERWISTIPPFEGAVDGITIPAAVQ